MPGQARHRGRPDRGRLNTNGTEGDDVIVAPLGNQGTVLGLGGNDTICLVDGASSSVASIRPCRSTPGAGTTRCINEAVPSGIGQRRARRRRRPLRRQRLPARRVYGAWSSELDGPDTELDVFETRGGDDWITSRGARGRDRRRHLDGRGPRHPHATGVPRAVPVDNGPDPDVLLLIGLPGRATSSSTTVTRRATIGDGTVLTWTAVDTFSMRALDRGSPSPSSAPTRDESLNVSQHRPRPGRADPDHDRRRRRQRRPRELPARQRRSR